MVRSEEDLAKILERNHGKIPDLFNIVKLEKSRKAWTSVMFHN